MESTILNFDIQKFFCCNWNNSIWYFNSFISDWE